MKRGERERILVTVKTYPTLSRKYGETVCTAGLREDGSWVRIYPVPFRRLNEPQQYKKFDWIECQLIRNTADPRIETYRPLDPTELVEVGHVGTEKGLWTARRKLVLGRPRVWTSIEELTTAARANEASLAVFKPADILDFTIDPAEERDWSATQLAQMRAYTNQLDMFDDNAWRETFRVIPKIPYEFRYRFVDADGKASNLRVIDWETGMLYWSCLRDVGGRPGERDAERAALAKVRQKYLDDFAMTKDVHFFLGTTQSWHFRAPNPWIVIGVFPIPHETQLGLF